MPSIFRLPPTTHLVDSQAKVTNQILFQMLQKARPFILFLKRSNFLDHSQLNCHLIDVERVRGRTDVVQRLRHHPDGVVDQDVGDLQRHYENNELNVQHEPDQKKF